MTDMQKQIQADIERHVTHLARFHNVTQDEVWREMYMKSLEYVTLNV